MAHHNETTQMVRPPTAILTRGFDPMLSVGSARPAVFRSSTYVFQTPEAAERAFDILLGRTELEPGEKVDLIYARISHANAEILEDQIVPLEPGAREAAVFNSGMAAIMTAFVTFLRPGDAMVYTMPCYGGTINLIHAFLEPFGVRCIPVPAGDHPVLEDTIRETPKLRAVFVETPANPSMMMTDIWRAAEAASQRPDPPVVMVDNTFLGPTFQHPLQHGADLVLYSATKYLSGFSDLLAGVALAKDPAHIAQMRSTRVMFGNILPPDECWMLDGRLPTVSLRMNRQSKNAQRIAEKLVEHPRVNRVFYPTLFSDPEQIKIRLSQCDFPGAMLSMELDGGRDAAFGFLRNLKIARLAVSLGGVETLACHPKTTTHSGLTPQELELSHITDGLVRISVGIEDPRDLLTDFQQALDAI
jgi:methionine-gamma-lyase